MRPTLRTLRRQPQPRKVGSGLVTPDPGPLLAPPDACGWRDGDDLRAFRGYVVNRWTGEVLSSLIADVIREREDERGQTEEAHTGFEPCRRRERAAHTVGFAGFFSGDASWRGNRGAVTSRGQAGLDALDVVAPVAGSGDRLLDAAP